MSLLNVFGDTLNAGADSFMQVLPLWVEGKEKQYLEDKEEAKKKRFLEENNLLTQEWMKSGSSETVEFDNPDEVKKTSEAVGKVLKHYNVGSGPTNINAANGTIGVSPKPADFYELDDPTMKLPVSYDADNNMVDPEKHYAVQAIKKYKQAPNQMYVDFKNAMSKVESGNDYKALGPVLGSDSTHAGQRALGKYQIMPAHLPKIGLNPNNEADIQKFLNNPKLQDRLFSEVADEAWKRAEGDPFWAGVYYYGAGDLDKDVPLADGKKMPTRREHANKILAAMGLPEFYGSGIGPNGKPFSGGKKKDTEKAFLASVGDAESAMAAEVFGESPKLVTPQNQYVNKINSFLESPAYLKASPEVRKNFMEQVIKPYQENLKLNRALDSDALDLYKVEMEERGRNLRSYWDGKIRLAKQKSSSAHRTEIGKALTSIRTQIKRIDDFRKQYATAKGTKKEELVKNFTDEFSKKEKVDRWGPDIIWEIFMDPAYEKTIDFDKMDAAYLKLRAVEKSLTNDYIGVSGSTFSGDPEDIPIDESGLNLSPPTSKYITFKE